MRSDPPMKTRWDGSRMLLVAFCRCCVNKGRSTIKPTCIKSTRPWEVVSSVRECSSIISSLQLGPDASHEGREGSRWRRSLTVRQVVLVRRDVTQQTARRSRGVFGVVLLPSWRAVCGFYVWVVKNTPAVLNWTPSLFVVCASADAGSPQSSAYRRAALVSERSSVQTRLKFENTSHKKLQTEKRETFRQVFYIHVFTGPVAMDTVLALYVLLNRGFIEFHGFWNKMTFYINNSRYAYSIMFRFRQHNYLVRFLKVHVLG